MIRFLRTFYYNCLYVRDYILFFIYKKKNQKIKIIIGSSKTKYNGWFSTEQYFLDITKQEDWGFLFDKKIDNILLEHVIEHLSYRDFVRFLEIVKKYLNKGATIRIAVPDKYHPSRYIRELTDVNGKEPGAKGHKYFYSIDDFEGIASQTGYVLRKLEYFNLNGLFIKNDFDYENGYISRCSYNYKGRFKNNPKEYKKMIDSVPFELKGQFQEHNISYTSLLVDFLL